MRGRSLVGIVMVWVTGTALLVGYVVPSRSLAVDVESGPCVDAESRLIVSRDERGYRIDVVAPADTQGAVPVRARLRRGVLMLWVTRTDDVTCQRALVVRPRLVGEPIRDVVVETRDGIVARRGPT